MTDDHSFLRMQVQTQRFTLGIPRRFSLASDGSRVLFLRAESGVDRRHNLWMLDLKSGEESKVFDATVSSGEEELTTEERARRERARESSAGVVGYDADKELRTAVFSLAGKLHLVDIATGVTKELVDVAVIDPRLNPAGTHVSYVYDRQLHVLELATGLDQVLAGEEDVEVSWGLAEFIAAEEMDRSRGYWWSPDGQTILAQRTDESAVSRWTIADPANPETPANAVAYPAAGTINATVSLAFLGVDGSRVDVQFEGWEYLGVVHWSAGGNPLLTVQSRDQRRLEIHEVNPLDGTTTLLHVETDPDWVELIPGSPAWTADGRLALVAVREDSYCLLVDGKQVTEPGIQVHSLVHVGKEILFSASETDSTQIHVYRTENGAVRRLSTSDGVHMAAGSAALTVIASRNLNQSGPTVSILADGVPVSTISSSIVDPEIDPRPQLLTLGKRGLRAALLLPTDYSPSDEKLPVLLDPYGGPHAQRVLQSRNMFASSQWLADQGFAVLITDGRGSSGRGPAWDREIAGNLADVTLADQIDALQAAAAEYPMLDLDRVAIRGWSYGGYLAALAVLRRPDVFHVASAGAPVTDWALYDTHYTERYLGTPQDNPECYDHNSLIVGAGELKRALLMLHGLSDDNVFAAHTLRLSAALLAAGRPHTFLPLAGAHMAGREENLMLLEIAWIKRELELVK